MNLYKQFQNRSLKGWEHLLELNRKIQFWKFIGFAIFVTGFIIFSAVRFYNR
jgi:hypothetical protein